MKKIAIIGGGAAALMLAAQLDATKYQVTVYEKKKTVGRKFLVAGEGGLNLTYNSSVEELIHHYSPSQFMSPFIRQFTNEDLMRWFNTIGVPAFTGSSKRVFPDLTIKPITVLNKIVDISSKKGVQFKLNTKWTGWSKEGHLCFEGLESVQPDIVVFALGGASWKVTGSDGAWRELFVERGVTVHPFRAANCAFGVDWDNNFIAAHEGKPIKNIALSHKTHRSMGELVVSEFGLEGNAIYPLSQKIQDSLQTTGSALIHLDLKPTMTPEQLATKYRNSRRTNVTDILKEDLNLDRLSISLLKQFSDRETYLNPDLLVASIKSVPITVTAAGEMDEAISTLGGIDLDEVDDNLQLKNIPDSYAIGEMLDWYAPTGGYLLQGCFSMGYVLARHLNEIG